MPTYKVRSNLSHGYVDDEGNAQTVNKAPGDEIDLSEEEAQPLLAAGAVTKGDDSYLSDHEDKLAELQSMSDELAAEVTQVQQEIKDAREALLRDPGKEYGTLVAAPEAAPAKATEGAEDYNTLSYVELKQTARERGLETSGTKGVLVNRLNADDQAQGGEPVSSADPASGDDPETPNDNDQE